MCRVCALVHDAYTCIGLGTVCLVEIWLVYMYVLYIHSSNKQLYVLGV